MLFSGECLGTPVAGVVGGAGGAAVRTGVDFAELLGRNADVTGAILKGVPIEGWAPVWTWTSAEVPASSSTDIEFDPSPPSPSRGEVADICGGMPRVEFEPINASACAGS